MACIWYGRYLVDELVEGVLPVGSRLSEADLSGLEGEDRPVLRHPLTITLHVHLAAQEEKYVSLCVSFNLQYIFFRRFTC